MAMHPRVTYLSDSSAPAPLSLAFPLLWPSSPPLCFPTTHLASEDLLCLTSVGKGIRAGRRDASTVRIGDHGAAHFLHGFPQSHRGVGAKLVTTFEAQPRKTMTSL